MIETSEIGAAGTRGGRAMSPRRFAASLSGPPLVRGGDGTLSHWRDVAPDIEQPALAQHYVTIHLGGPKRVRRRGDGATLDQIVEPGALSIIPAGAAYHWSTEGPVEFAHVYIGANTLRSAAAADLDRDIAAPCERFAIRDPLLEPLLLAMLNESAVPSAGSRVYFDTLLSALTLRVLRAHALATPGGAPARLALAPARLRRVRDFIEANLARDIGLADLAAAAAHSPWHFSRAFAQATGHAPYAYLIRRRIELSKRLLVDGSVSVAEVAAACGFQSPGQFARQFRRVTGVSPREYRHLAA